MSGYITIISNKIFQIYGSDVYMICFTLDLEELLNFDLVYIDPNQVLFHSYVSDIEMLQRRLNNELTYNKLHDKKNFFMLPNLNNVKELIRDLIAEQKTIQIFTKPTQPTQRTQQTQQTKKLKPLFKKDLLDKDINNTTDDTTDLDKKEFRRILKTPITKPDLV